MKELAFSHLKFLPTTPLFVFFFTPCIILGHLTFMNKWPLPKVNLTLDIEMIVQHDHVSSLKLHCAFLCPVVLFIYNKK